jgi:protoheme IX farnesyltransferase
VIGLIYFADGVLLAAGGSPDPLLLLHTVLGTALVAGGASALNQLLEKNSDALMRRTENRPLPAGRLQPLEVWIFGVSLGVAGIAWLAVALRQPCTPLVAAFTFAAYVGIYTPLKPRTPLNTLVGAVPGALPPVIGWTAVRGTFGTEAWVLFAILFLWQVPHFLAIAWIYRDDYARAGLRMLPVVDPEGTQTGRNMVVYCLALIPASLAPVMQGAAGPFYVVGALLLGAGFLASAAGFRRAPSVGQARRVLRASLLYLPGLLLLLILDGRLGIIVPI